MWLLIDDQVERLADPNFPRRPSPRVTGAHELVARENYIVYFDQDKATAPLPSGLSCSGQTVSVALASVGKVCAYGVRGGNGASQFQRRYAPETVGLLILD